MLAVKNKKNTITYQLVCAVFGVFAVVALPQVTHLFGRLTGTGTAISIALSPMHLPVIFIGLTVGPVAGAVTGALGPVTSFAVTGMPYVTNLPLMAIELTVYGLTAGLLSGVKIPTAAKVVITQIAGRAAYILAVAAAVYLFGSAGLSLTGSLTSLAGGLLGVALQLALIPLCSKLTDRMKK